MTHAIFKLRSTEHSSRLEDPSRLGALRGYAILDTPGDPDFDEIVSEAASALHAPMALVSLVDEKRQWLKAAQGFGPRQTTLDRSICATAIEHGGVFVVNDASADPRVNFNPLVYGNPNIAFYAGAPLVTPDGHSLGMVCVLDTIARPAGISPRERALLEALAARVMVMLEMRRKY